MSNALALAAVTAVLKDLLINGIIEGNLSANAGEVTVSAFPPDRVLEGPGEPTRLNLFLYQVTPNQGWRNVAMPMRDAQGARLTNPPLALDLHYMLTAFTSQELQAEMLLGHGMQTLHETSVLPRAAIRRSLSGLTGALAAIAGSELAEQVEQIKICHQAMTMEDMSRLWTSFQTVYRPSAYYLVTVVLIESRRSVKTGPPVRRSNLLVVPFRHPVVEQVISSQGENVYIESGHTLLIEGQRLRSEITRVKIDGREPPVAASLMTDQRLELPVPDDVLAGLHALQIVHPVDFHTGSAAEPHRGFESNVAAFVLHPRIALPTTSSVISRTETVVNPATGVSETITLRSGNLNLPVTPGVGRGQRVVVMLNQVASGPQPAQHDYTFRLPPRTSFVPQTALQIAFTDVVPGDYLVRLQVDGAENALTVDSNGQYNGPKVTI